jgi:hypothetical protein
MPCGRALVPALTGFPGMYSSTFSCESQRRRSSAASAPSAHRGAPSPPTRPSSERTPPPTQPRSLSPNSTKSWHTPTYVLSADGQVLKQVVGADGGIHVLCRRLDLTCLGTDWNRCWVLNPATGALWDMTQSSAPEHKGRVTLSNPYTFFALG